MEDPRATIGFLNGIHWGLKGMEIYANDVENLNMKKEKFDSGWHACMAITPQWSGRYATAQWLKSIITQNIFNGSINSLLQTAQENYLYAYKEWQQFDQIGQKENAWDSKNEREEMATYIKKAIKFEKRAIQSIEAILPII